MDLTILGAPGNNDVPILFRADLSINWSQICVIWIIHHAFQSVPAEELQAVGETFLRSQ